MNFANNATNEDNYSLFENSFLLLFDLSFERNYLFCCQKEILFTPQISEEKTGIPVRKLLFH